MIGSNGRLIEMNAIAERFIAKSRLFSTHGKFLSIRQAKHDALLQRHIAQAQSFAAINYMSIVNEDDQTAFTLVITQLKSDISTFFPKRQFALVRLLRDPKTRPNFRAVARAYDLTVIEKQVLELIYDGLTYAEIAPIAMRETSQTRAIGARILKKLKVGGKEQAIRLLERL